jgi:hypothetical protein
VRSVQLKVAVVVLVLESEGLSFLSGMAGDLEVIMQFCLFIWNHNFFFYLPSFLCEDK